MEIFKLSDYDLSKMRLLESQGSNSTIYDAGDTLIKIVHPTFKSSLEETLQKFLCMDGINIEGVVLPKDIICKNGVFRGYTMPKIEGQNLCDYFEGKRFLDVPEYLKIMKEVSQILRKLHKEGIICKDFSLDNIILGNDGKIHFVDFDGCTYKGFSSPYLNSMLVRYIVDFRDDRISIDKNMDRLSLMLSFFRAIFLREIQYTRMAKYDGIADNIQTLRNARNCALQLKDLRSSLGTLPYIDEFIENPEPIVLDRIIEMQEREKRSKTHK